MAPLNHKMTTSFLAPSLFHVTKNWYLKDRRFPIQAHVFLISTKLLEQVTSGSRELGKNAALICNEGFYYPKSPFPLKVEIFCDKKSTELKWTQTDGTDVVACVKGYFFVKLQ